MKNIHIFFRKWVIDKRRIGILDFCESCVMKKQKRLSFNIGKHDTSEALRYVHDDLWGSLNVTPSLPAKQYFVSIIDYYTKKV